MSSPLEASIISALKNIYDPELPVNIYDLGLIYELKIDDSANVLIRMTLTAPNCPVAEDMPEMVRSEVQKVHGVKEVEVEIVFDPPWSKEMLSEAALLELGLI
ncbi:MAG: SUF system Fe-S cluster assembly protein [Bacteroidetes bacterium]|nr:SUF system Fe-S cluster assembly protein [Bacteroidota bacterium]